jgi:glucose-1-phosphate thymidylyltransferase
VARWKGIILAGGTGSRLFPLTHVVNKHLLPVFDKPMIYYPLTTLMMSGIRDFIVISGPESVNQIERLLGDGARWGLNIEYAVQERPGGIAECFRIVKRQIEGCSIALILGDNIFYGSALPERLRRAMAENRGATVFGYEVSDPTSFGIVVLDQDGRPIAIEEKPKVPRSRLAVPGLYFYDESVTRISLMQTPSDRGELEITDVNKAYLERGTLNVVPLGRGVAWLDGGTHADLFEAGQFIKVLEERTGLKIACPEEVALRSKLIDRDAFRRLLPEKARNAYESYLFSLLDG